MLERASGRCSFFTRRGIDPGFPRVVWCLWPVCVAIFLRSFSSFLILFAAFEIEN